MRWWALQLNGVKLSGMKVTLMSLPNPY
jgi:hypothetical protein